MQIDFTQKLKDLDGKDLENVDGLKAVATNALLAMYQDEQNLSGEDKAKRYVLATRIYANPSGIDLAVEEVALVKKLVAKLFGPLVVGQAWAMLELKKEP